MVTSRCTCTYEIVCLCLYLHAYTCIIIYVYIYEVSILQSLWSNGWHTYDAYIFQCFLSQTMDGMYNCICLKMYEEMVGVAKQFWLCNIMYDIHINDNVYRKVDSYFTCYTFWYHFDTNGLLLDLQGLLDWDKLTRTVSPKTKKRQI